MNIQESIRRLEQELVETTYSRKFIKEKVLEDISSLDSELNFAEIAVLEYLLKSYYTSKNIRLEYLSSTNTREIVLMVCSVVLPLRHQTSIQAVVGQIANYLDYESIFDGVKTAAELLAVMAPSGLFTIIPARSSGGEGSMLIQSNVTLDKKTEEFIAKTMYLPPLKCCPNKVTHVGQSGYLNGNGSLILNGGYHEEPIALDVINILSKIKLSIDPVITHFEEPIPEAKKPLTLVQDIQRREVFITQRDVSETLCEEIMDSGNLMYFTWKYDSRGRIYSQGYNINIQSTDYKKSLICLYHKQLIKIEE
mgnify:CR=1 FL=1